METDFQYQIRIQMLGGFSFFIEDESLLEDNGGNRKVWTLLAYLLVNRHRILEPAELIRLLCNDDRSRNPANAVKNLVYRLRVMLADSDLPAYKYVLQKGGIYSWNNEIPCILDTEELSSAYYLTEEGGLSPGERITHYIKVINLYKGRFLPRLSGDAWVGAENRKYLRIYMDSVYAAYSLIQNHPETAAMTLEYYEESAGALSQNEGIQLLYIKSLIEMERRTEAQRIYETVSQSVAANGESGISADFRPLHRVLLKDLHRSEPGVLGKIQASPMDKDMPEGACYCDFELFKNLYQYMVRVNERSSIPILLMHCTLTDSAPGRTREMEMSMKLLGTVIHDSLRRSDAYARYGYNQYVVMFVGATLTDGKKLGSRIRSAFKQRVNGKGIKLTYRLQPGVNEKLNP